MLLVNKLSLIPVVTIFIATGSLSAHDFYILPERFLVPNNYKLEVAFHNGDAFPESEAPPSLARLKDARLLSVKGTFPIKGIRVDGKRAVGTLDLSNAFGNLVLSARTSPNFIELSPDKFLDYIKEEGLTSVIDWRAQHNETNKPGRERYSKFAKSLLLSGTPDNFYRTSIGFPIEIIPEANPYTLTKGSVMPCLVILRGEPVAGLQIEAAWAANGKDKTIVIGRTDAQGRILVPIAEAGKWRLHTLLMERCAEPAVADWESFWASLTFEIR